MRLFPALAAATLAAAAAAPAGGEPWQHAGGRLAVPAAGLSFPDKAGTVALTQTSEASLGGQGVDDVAQYRSADEQVYATLFVYLTAYADAALAAYELDKVIRQHRGPDARLESSRVLPAGGTAAGAIRVVYVNTEGGKSATTGAVLRAGHWIVTVRVSGPSARQAEVEAALDALISGLRVSGAAVDPVAPLQVSDCPATAKKAAKRSELRLEGAGLGSDPMTRMLIDSALSAGLGEGKDPKAPPFPASIADNGRHPVCIRERVTVGDNVIDLMQAAGDTANPTAVIGVINDAGKTVEMRRIGNGGPYSVHLHNVARTANFGSYDRLLTAGQVADLLQGSPKMGAMRSQIVYKADGTSATEVYVAVGK
ncbi:MAG: hypothetical protein JO013_14110 [Alphaproteobacteria bacterium]|nr:hypothetical protein [Alphaproteobacteria bacterium]